MAIALRTSPYLESYPLTAYGRAHFDCTRKAWTYTDKRACGSVRYNNATMTWLRYPPYRSLYGSRFSVSKWKFLLPFSIQELNFQPYG
jgi:hypothetical protein